MTNFSSLSTNIDDVLGHYCSFLQNFNLASGDANAAVTAIAPPPFGGELKTVGCPPGSANSLANSYRYM